MSCSRVFLLSAAVMVATSGLVCAQDQQTSTQNQQTSTQGQTSQSQLQEITVTATRREEDINRVPISITAFTPQQLEQEAITVVDDLFRYTPGVTYTKDGEAGSTNISIRGITSSNNAATTAVYIDDTPIQVRKNGFSPLEDAYPLLVDLSRVEVLRGPQGTLFGSGAEGGAIRFITKDPDFTAPSFYARAEYGQIVNGGPTNGYAISGNLPLSNDVAILVQAADEQVGGYIDRYASNGYETQPNANTQRQSSARMALRWAPTDSLTVTPSVFYQATDKGDIDLYWLNISDPSNNNFENANPAKYQSHANFLLSALKLQWDLPGVSLFSNTSYFNDRQTREDDYTSFIPSITGFYAYHVGYSDYFTYNPPTSPPTNQPNLLPNIFIQGTYPDNRVKVFVQEVRAQSKGEGPITWVVGFFYSRVSESSQIFIGSIPPVAGWNQLLALMPPLYYSFYGYTPLCGGGNFSYCEDDESVEKQTAGFGEVSWEPLRGLKFTVGARYQHDNLSYLQSGAGPYFGGTLSGGGDSSENPFTPKYGVSYQINSANMVYGTVAKGYRDGGPNPPLFSACDASLQQYGLTRAPYHADSVWSYEIGSKNQLLQNHFSIAGSAFIIDWNNIQTEVLLPSCSLQLTTNLAAARSQGGDLQFVALPTDQVTLSAALSYIESRFSRTISTAPGVILATDGDYVGESESPPRPWSGVAGAEYRFVSFTLPARIRFDYQYQGRAPITSDLNPQTTAIFNANAIRLGGYGQLDAQVGVAWKNFDLSLYSHNLLNAHPTITAFRDATLTDLANTNGTLVPLTVGLQGIYRY